MTTCSKSVGQAGYSNSIGGGGKFPPLLKFHTFRVRSDVGIAVMPERQELTYSKRAAGCFALSMSRLRVPQTILVRLHAHGFNVVILTLETLSTLDV